MAESKMPKLILLDSCAYFRLGVSFRPLLFRLTGDPEYALKVLSDLDCEYNRNPRLKTKFWWVNQKEHPGNMRMIFPRVTPRSRRGGRS